MSHGLAREGVVVTSQSDTRVSMKKFRNNVIVEMKSHLPEATVIKIWG